MSLLPDILEHTMGYFEFAETSVKVCLQYAMLLTSSQ